MNNYVIYHDNYYILLLYMIMNYGYGKNKHSSSFFATTLMWNSNMKPLQRQQFKHSTRVFSSFRCHPRIWRKEIGICRESMPSLPGWDVILPIDELIF